MLHYFLKCFYGILQPCFFYYFAETTKCLRSPKVPENFVQNKHFSEQFGVVNFDSRKQAVI